MKPTVLLFCCSFAISGLLAQPAITPNSVVNAASYAQKGMPNYGIAQGSVFIVKGQNLGAKGVVTATSFPLQTTMGNTSMKISLAGTSIDVLMIYVVAGQPGADDQLAGIVPSTAPTGTGTITVTFNGRTSAPAPITVVSSSFGIFTINQGGAGPGVFTDPNFKVNTLVNAAHAGDLMFIWGTGLGPISASDANTPPVSNVNVPAEVYVGNVKAAIGYQGRSGCCSGIDQILFTVPPGVSGCYVPVTVKIGNVASNFVTMSIADTGNICSDALGYSTAELQKAQTTTSLTVADLSLFRLNIKISAPGQGTIQGAADQGSGYFHRYNGPGGILGALPIALPSVGCIVYTIPTQGSGLFDAFTIGPQHDYIGADGGPQLDVSGPQGPRQLLRLNTGTTASPDFRYKGDLGGDPPFSTSGPAYLSPGAYTISGSGGQDAGSFSTSLTIPNVTSSVWANEDALNTILRSQDLTLTLNPTANNPYLAVVGNSYDTSVGQNGIFQCIIPQGATSFSIPGYVLASLPASGVASDFGGPRTGFLGVLASSTPTHIQAKGVDAGSSVGFQLFVKNVSFQ